jgi:hypothetical protein
MPASDAGAAPESRPDLAALRQAILSGDPSRAMPALAGLRLVAEEQAIPLLLLGLQQSTFIIRSFERRPTFMSLSSWGVYSSRFCSKSAILA